MDYTLWKAILLDWANSTGFLVKNYENLTDTSIEAFFQKFKTEIKSVRIKSANAIEFVKDYYPEFHLKLSEGDNNNGDARLPEDEYVYVYSMFLHYSCVRYADVEMQSVCSGLLEKYQKIMAKFLEYLIKSVKYTRESIQDAIEEAETCDASSPFVSPLNRSFSMASNKDVPRTPRTSKLLENWNNDNRNLKAQLETERFEKGYLEMQVKYNEEKISKLDIEFKKALAEINDLKKHITALMEEIASPSQSKVDPMVNRLRKCLDEKEDELASYIQNLNEMTDTNSFLNEKILFAEKQIKLLSEKTLDLYDDIDKLKSELEDREKAIKYMNGANKELEELVRELRSYSNSEKRLGETSFDVLNSSTLLNSSTSNTSFAYSAEENMADAVVDIRLIEQQRRNVELNETIERLTGELDRFRTAANEMYTELSQKSLLPDVAHVLPENGRLVREMIRENAENVSRLAAKEAELVEINERYERDAAEVAVKLAQKGEQMFRERQTHEEQMASIQSKIDETEQLLAAMKANFELLNAENEKQKRELETVKRSLESCISERDVLNSKLLQSQSELKTSTEMLQKVSAEAIVSAAAKESLQSQLNEVNGKLASTEGALKTMSDRVGDLSKEKTDLAQKLTEAEHLVVALNGEIVEMQQEAARQNETIQQKEAIIGRSETLIGQMNDEKVQLEKDNLSLAHARAKAETKINDLEDQVAVQSKQLEEQRKDSIQKLEAYAQETAALELKLSATDSQLVAVADTARLQSEEISKLKQDIALMGEKYATDMQEQHSQRDEALATIESLRSKIVEVQSAVEASHKLQAASSEQIDILTNEKSALEMKIEEADATIKTLNDELIAARHTVEGDQRKLSECETASKRLAETIERLTDDKNKAEEEVGRLNRLQEEAVVKIAALDVEVARLRAEREQLSKDIETNANEQAILNAKFQEVMQASAEAASRFANELETSETRIKELNELIETHKTEQDHLKTRLTAAEERSTADVARIADLTSEIVELNGIVDTLRSENVEMTETKSNVQSKVRELSDQLDAANVRVADSETRIEQLNTQKSEIEVQVAELSERLRVISGDLSKSHEECLRVQSELDTAILANTKVIEEQQTRHGDEKSRMECEINELTKKCDSIETDLQLEREHMARERVSFEQKLQELTDEKVQKESDIKLLSEKIGFIEAKLAQTELEQDENLAKLRMESAETEAKLKGEKDQLEADRTQLKLEIEKLASKYEQLEKAQEESNRLLEAESNLRLEQQTLRDADKSRFEREIVELTKTIKSIEADMQSERENMATERTSFEQMVQELKQEKAQKESEVKALSEKIDSVEAALVLANLELQQTVDRSKTESAEKEAKLEEAKIQLKIELEQARVKYEQLKQTQEDELRQRQTEFHAATSEKQSLEEKLQSMKTELERLTVAMEQAQADSATVVKEKNALVTKIIELNRTVDEQQLQLTETKSMEAKLKTHAEQMESVQKELVKSVVQVEQHAQENEKLKSELSNLREENRLLVDASTNKEQVNALKSQIAYMQKKLHDSADKWNKEREAMLQDNKILKAKLMKERETAVEKHKEHEQQVTEVRHEFEEKLEKMKDKMKTLYSAEMSKVKAKHEMEVKENGTEMQLCVDKIEQYEGHIQQLTNQLHAKNQQHLSLLKENEIMKSKMRTLECQPSLSSLKPTHLNIPTSFIDKIRAGGTFKMEDEPDEVYNENFLEDLKNGGSFSIVGRDSLTQDEINRRNSMVPPHLRSTYQAQYQDQNINEDSLFKIGDDRKTSTLDDSLLSTKSDSRRGTIYKRPGPPTPSKNGGRLSFGGTNAELPRTGILRESNRALELDAPLPTAKQASKKSTPGRLRSMFSSAKIKDEMENIDPNRISQLILPVQFDRFSTSTPQRRLAGLPGGPTKFDAILSFSHWDHSLSILRTTETAVYESHVITTAIARPSIELTHAEEALLPIDSRKPSSNKRSSKKLMNNRRRRTSLVSTCYKWPTTKHQSNKRREKRIDAFSKCRKFIDDESVLEVIQPASKANATFSIHDEPKDSLLFDESYMVKCEVDAFHDEIDRLKVSGSTSMDQIEEDTPINEYDENTNFEQLCSTKVSQHPYENTDMRQTSMDSSVTNDTNIPAPTSTSGDIDNTVPLSQNSSLNNTSTTAKANSHCTHPIYLHQHKIPQIVRHKSLARINLSEADANAFRPLHPFIAYYIVSITVAFFSILFYVIRTN